MVIKMDSPATDLIKRLAAVPHWQTALRRAWSIAGTDARAQRWMGHFIDTAAKATDLVLPRADPTGHGHHRFAIDATAISIPPELTILLRDALAKEGPVLRASVFMLVGAAVRAPLIAAHGDPPWNTFEKLHMVGRALPLSRRGRWGSALAMGAVGPEQPRTAAARRLLAHVIGGTPPPLPHPGTAVPMGAALDLVFSALTFRACATLAADRHGSSEGQRAA